MLRLLAVVLRAASRLEPEPHRSQLERFAAELKELARAGPQPTSSR